MAARRVRFQFLRNSILQIVFRRFPSRYSSQGTAMTKLKSLLVEKLFSFIKPWFSYINCLFHSTQVRTRAKVEQQQNRC